MRNPAKTLKRLLDCGATALAMVPAGFDLLLRMTRDRLGRRPAAATLHRNRQRADAPGPEAKTHGAAAANADLPSLRAERGLAGDVSRIPRRSAQARLHRPPQSERRNRRSRRARAGCADGPAGRACRPRRHGDERVLAAARSDPPHAPRRLALHRRLGFLRRRRLSPSRRPANRPGERRRAEGQPGRGGKPAQRPSGRRRVGLRRRGRPCRESPGNA